MDGPGEQDFPGPFSFGSVSGKATRTSFFLGSISRGER